MYSARRLVGDFCWGAVPEVLICVSIDLSDFEI